MTREERKIVSGSVFFPVSVHRFRHPLDARKRITAENGAGSKVSEAVGDKRCRLNLGFSLLFPLRSIPSHSLERLCLTSLFEK